MLALALALLAACPAPDKSDTGDGASTGDTTPTGPGTLLLTFRMDDDYIAAMAEDGEAPVGPFYGSIYAEDDASSLGPNDGAQSLLDFTVEGLDLTPDGGPDDVSFATDPLDPQIVWILGCLDADGNGCDDVGDPITLPSENKARVEAGVETAFEVYMGMLRP
ncbi:MAG: hypothetical protein ACOZNI_02235 [Myxococcota bacterium]